MVIKTKCANCGAGLAAPAEKAGARLKCPKCGSAVQIPSAAPAGVPGAATPAAQKRPSAPVAANIDLEDLPGGADLSAFDSSGHSDPFSSAMNLTAGATLSPMSGSPLGGPPKRSGGLFGLESWVWMVIAGCVSAVVMIGLLAIAMRRNREPMVEAPAVAENLTVERIKAPPRPVTGQGGRSQAHEPIITSAPMPQPISDAYESVVMITPFDASGAPLPHGSGFVANEAGLVATAYHLLAKAHSARVLFNNGETFDVVGYRAFDAGKDLAVVELGSLPSKFTPIAFVSDEGVQPRIKVYSIGHPEPNRYIIESGTVSGIVTADQLPPTVRVKHSFPADSIWMQTDAAVVGDSGGSPLINEAGELVGIASFQVTSGNKTTGYASVVFYLQGMLNALSAEPTPLAPAEPAK